MRRLGYNRYVAQGGDVGAGVTDAMGRQAPEGLVGIHTNLLVPALGGAQPSDTEQEREAPAPIKTFRRRQRLLRGAGHPAADDRLRPAGLAGRPRRLDGSTTTPTPTTRSPTPSSTGPRATSAATTPRQHHAYWLTGTGASAARSYWEAYGPDAPAAGRQPLPPPPIPVGFTTFPGEIWRTPRSWAEKAYPSLSYFDEADRGGHFAAWEEPELFAAKSAPRSGRFPLNETIIRAPHALARPREWAPQLVSAVESCTRSLRSHAAPCASGGRRRRSRPDRP